MKKSWLLSALGPFVLVALVAATAAHAGLELNAEGGLSLLEGTAHDGYSTASPMLGASALIGLTPFTEIGPFYEYNLVSDSGNTGHQQFFGGMLRFSLLPLLFLDAQVGVSSINNGAGVTRQCAQLWRQDWLSAGLQRGFAQPVHRLSLSPDQVRLDEHGRQHDRLRSDANVGILSLFKKGPAFILNGALHPRAPGLRAFSNPRVRAAKRAGAMP
jgi:hypothetical protein